MPEATFLSEKGKREKNEDSYGGVDDEFFVVADGLGGRPAGEVASETAVDAALNAFDSSKKKPMEDIYKEANKAIIEKIKENPDYSGMGTTLVTCLIFGSKAMIANVGDSRAYLFRDEELKSVSNDDRGMAGFLTAALGVKEGINVHTNEIEARQDDLVLLCTDGLTDYVEDEVIGKILKSDSNLKEKAEGLVEAALKMGTTDNVTVCLISM